MQRALHNHRKFNQKHRGRKACVCLQESRMRNAEDFRRPKQTSSFQINEKSECTLSMSLNAVIHTYFIFLKLTDFFY
jgi:hypothetical protein